MKPPREREVQVNGIACRVWEKGRGEALGYLAAGPIGLNRWTPFLERLAERRRVIVPSFPGFPGALGQDRLDGIEDWVCAALDLLEGAGLAGADLVGGSVGGALVAESAAFCPHIARRLVLIGPFGLHSEEEPIPDLWSRPPKEFRSLLTRDPAPVDLQLDCPEGTDEIEWSIVNRRSVATAARLLWPLGDLGLAKRLHRIAAPTLLLWGSEDAVIPPSYAKRFAEGICEAHIRSIEHAGHLADLDRPEETARAVLEFLE